MCQQYRFTTLLFYTIQNETLSCDNLSEILEPAKRVSK